MTTTTYHLHVYHGSFRRWGHIGGTHLTRAAFDAYLAHFREQNRSQDWGYTRVRMHVIRTEVTTKTYEIT